MLHALFIQPGNVKWPSFILAPHYRRIPVAFSTRDNLE